MVVVIEGDLASHKLSSLFHVDPLGAVDHHFGNLRIVQQRLQRPIAQHLVQDVLKNDALDVLRQADTRLLVNALHVLLDEGAALLGREPFALDPARQRLDQKALELRQVGPGEPRRIQWLRRCHPGLLPDSAESGITHTICERLTARKGAWNNTLPSAPITAVSVMARKSSSLSNSSFRRSPCRTCTLPRSSWVAVCTVACTAILETTSVKNFPFSSNSIAMLPPCHPGRSRLASDAICCAVSFRTIAAVSVGNLSVYGWCWVFASEKLPPKYGIAVWIGRPMVSSL